MTSSDELHTVFTCKIRNLLEHSIRSRIVWEDGPSPGVVFGVVNKLAQGL